MYVYKSIKFVAILERNLSNFCLHPSEKLHKTKNTWN